MKPSYHSTGLAMDINMIYQNILVWYPPEPSIHKKVFKVATGTFAITIPLPPKAIFYNDDLKFAPDIICQTKVLPIKRYIFGQGSECRVAFSNCPEGALQPNAPSAFEILQCLPDLAEKVCTKGYCYKCKTENLMHPSYIMMTSTCIKCGWSTYDQMREAIVRNDYRVKASVEFEGVEGLDSSLWQGKEGLT